jgi:hypothetical protein
MRIIAWQRLKLSFHKLKADLIAIEFNMGNRFQCPAYSLVILKGNNNPFYGFWVLGSGFWGQAPFNEIISILIFKLSITLRHQVPAP